MNASETSLRIQGREVRRFAPNHPWDRNFFLLWVGLIWLGLAMGFGPQIAQHFEMHAAPYPIIVHIHAAAFVGWVILLTVQILLIRSRRLDLHRRLGVFGAALAGAMILIGPATALIVHRLSFGQPGDNPAFLSVQLTDILAFAGLIAAALLWRHNPSAHKRLVLLATLYISDAGFARWLGLAGPHPLFYPWLTHLGPTSLLALVVGLYLGNDILVIGLGAYDWITRGRLHPAYVAGVAWTAALQLTAVSLLTSPVWKPIALELIGH